MPASGDFPLGEPELAFLRELTRAQSRFLVVGLGAAVLQGADTATQDLDLWFRSLGDPAIALAAAKAGGIFVTRSSRPMIAGEGLDRIDLVVHCDGLRSFDAEYENAIDLPIADFSIKTLPLERVLASKRAAGRPNDKAALEALRAALAARAATGKR